MGEVRRHKPFRLSDKAYRKLCMLVDERDEGCVICGNPAVEHHHIIFRSEGGEDRLENLIALCHEHHQLCAHGLDKHYWQQDFLAMMKLPESKRFAKKHSKQLAKIYAHERR